MTSTPDGGTPEQLPADPNTNCIYQFNLDCGRMGSLDGVFVATPAEVAKAIGQRADFGECLGKHSDISATLEANNITFATANQEFIALFLRLGLSTGINPLSYVRCPECGYNPDDCECEEAEDEDNVADDDT